MDRRTLLSLGSINADFQVRVDRPLGSDETLLAHDFRRLSGGKASNTAFLGARFGHRSLLFGRVGDDELAEQVLAPLRDVGVDLDGVSRAVGVATGVSMIMVPPSAKKHIVLATNANDCWDEAARAALVQRLEQAPTPAVLVMDVEVPARIAEAAIGAAERAGIAVVLDPSFPDRIAPALLSRVHAITPNAEEAAALCGQPVRDRASAIAAARRLRAQGAAIVCLKEADGGCVLATADGLWRVPGGAVEPVDTTGAGDAFTGVLAIALLEEQPPLEATLLAVAAAQCAVAGYGSQPAYPRREQLTAIVERLRPDVERLDD